MKTIVKKSFTSPDEVHHPKEKMKIEVVEIAGFKFKRHTAKPGYKGQNCEIHHLLYIISGKFQVRMHDGAEVEFSPGDVGVIPAGHDLRVAGSEPVIWLEVPH